MKNFNEFGLSQDVIRAVSDLGFEESTPIQEKAIPVALSGRDMIGQAQTGTGKTAAFGLPIIDKLKPATDYVQALIMAPTRELAIQVSDELNKLAKYKKVTILPVYGGQDISRQIRALKKKPHAVVGTPGRLLDHIRRKTIQLDKVEIVVLDEADEMLDMGFLEDIQSILEMVPAERQTMLFSATMPPKIQQLARRFLQNPEHISITPKQVSTPQIEQSYIEIHERQKFDAMTRILDMISPELAIIFGRTKRRVDELAEALKKRGYSADGLHGDLSQSQRDQVMKRFRDGSLDILVATDVAARGLDVSGVTHVFNFDMPQDPESYVHRIGRTGRAGKEGYAITFVTPREIDHLHFLEKVIKQRISKQPLPSMAEAMEGKQRMAAEKILQMLDDPKIAEFKAVAHQLLDQYDAVQLVAAALRVMTRDSVDAEIELTPEQPLRAKKRPDDKGRRDRFGRSDGNNFRSRYGKNYPKDDRSGRRPKSKNRTGSDLRLNF